MEGLARTQSIACLKEKSLKENFPYLFDPNYSHQGEKDQRKWAVLSIIENNKVKGYLFIHVFKGIKLKTRPRQSPRKPIERVLQQREVLLLIFFGERRYVEYLKTQMEILSTRYPQNLIDAEIE